jgi:hypothetical protein
VELTTILALVGEVVTLVGVVAPIIAKTNKLANGTRCQLRSEMLRIYYKNNDSKTFRQYEFENFVYLYEAYKALKGNSFIDRIYEEIKTWEIVP